MRTRFIVMALVGLVSASEASAQSKTMCVPGQLSTGPGGCMARPDTSPQRKAELDSLAKHRTIYDSLMRSNGEMASRADSLRNRIKADSITIVRLTAERNQARSAMAKSAVTRPDLNSPVSKTETQFVPALPGVPGAPGTDCLGLPPIDPPRQCLGRDGKDGRDGIDGLNGKDGRDGQNALSVGPGRAWYVWPVRIAEIVGLGCGAYWVYGRVWGHHEACLTVRQWTFVGPPEDRR